MISGRWTVSGENDKFFLKPSQGQTHIASNGVWSSLAFKSGIKMYRTEVTDKNSDFAGKATELDIPKEYKVLFYRSNCIVE